MARATRSTHPVQALREVTTSLEASILLCLAKPGKKAVHELRTFTRRIEAQFELLSMLPELPPHDEQQRKALRLLKKLRHAAGQVRDIDVQRNLIRDEAASHKAASRTNSEIRKEASHLGRDLKRKRDKEADRLLRLLRKHRTTLPDVFQELLDALTLAESITVSEAKLTALVRGWYKDHRDRHTPDAVPHDTAELHLLRKRAKLARYLAESAPKSATAAHRLAAQFEKLQQAGGRWHDLLLLAEVATSELGDSAKLPQRFAAKADRALATFKRRLRYKI